MFFGGLFIGIVVGLSLGIFAKGFSEGYKAETSKDKVVLKAVKGTEFNMELNETHNKSLPKQDILFQVDDYYSRAEH